MITEDYVSFETAKLLKEKGFDSECKRMFRASKSFEPKVYDHSEWITNEDLCNLYQNCEFATIPTLQMAMKWLREKHNIFINISFRFSRNADNDINFSYYAEKYENYYGYGDGEFISYEEACEAAIKYCLEKLI